MKLITSLILILLLSACTIRSVGLPTDDMDIYYYKNINFHKDLRETDVLYLVDNETSLPEKKWYIGTLEFTKNIIECDDETTCDPVTKSKFNSSEYLDYYAKRIGADYALFVEEDRIQTRHKERRICLELKDECNPRRLMYQKSGPQYICAETCKEYDTKIIKGYVKVQRTVVDLYRSRD